MTVHTQIATPPKSTKSRNSDISVLRSTNSNRDLGLISESICTEEFEYLDLADFGGVAFSMDSVIPHLLGKYQSTECISVHKAYVRVTF